MKTIIYTAAICFLFSTGAYAQTSHKAMFKPLGKDQRWTVPAGVTQIQLKLWGAGGAGNNYGGTDASDQNGGGGGFATAILKVVPGEQLTIIVGSGGLQGAGPGAYAGGGGKACGKGGRGGGRSAIRNSTGTELITAGAGGGGGDFSPDLQSGNGGGGLQGQPSHWKPQDGGPGTQTAGGAGGVRFEDGLPYGSNPGSQFLGGYAGCADNGYNGSGGGGYYGGGSGTDVGDGAGGGGSSFIPEGGATVAANSNIPGNTTDPDYRYPAGYGGAKASDGKCGLVIIRYMSNNLNILSTAENPGLQKAHITSNDIIVHPNPATSNISIKYTAATAGKYVFELSDLTGRVLTYQILAAVQGINTATFDVSRYPQGTYFINMIEPVGSTRKLQVTKQ